MLDEPTRGIDIAARVDIYELIGRMAAEGKAVLIISSELPELFGITDRILVMRRGRLVADLVTSETTQEAVMQLAAVDKGGRSLESGRMFLQKPPPRTPSPKTLKWLAAG